MIGNTWFYQFVKIKQNGTLIEDVKNKTAENTSNNMIDSVFLECDWHFWTGVSWCLALRYFHFHVGFTLKFKLFLLGTKSFHTNVGNAT